MSVAVITGSAGLIGSEAALYFGRLGFTVVGIDNDMRRVFFGTDASTNWNRTRIERELGSSYYHEAVDIRDADRIDRVFRRYGRAIDLVIHAAAQPSHDWAAKDPVTDFQINAVGTLNLLEATRQCAEDAVFIFASTNKVYGDHPNSLPLVELETRWELPGDHRYFGGVTEDMPTDRALHSLFGASKLAADTLVQEYGLSYRLRTACLRGGTFTGPNHSPSPLHGFLAYLMQCVMTGTPYTVFGYKGKQVRDVIHAHDVASAFHEIFKAPRASEVYNLGGGRHSNASILEAISLAEEVAGEGLRWSYTQHERLGDHVWWISDNGRFKSHYPDWKMEFDVRRILEEMREANALRWRRERARRQAGSA